ncbi:MAG: chitobiase/beta-hexosaminidase C-terminal domain-containing protein [Prevotella sp.]|nr:chitobiase/beta-hexosaminidase C-terminal domain-containing protein [Prevotella sp.]
MSKIIYDVYQNKNDKSAAYGKYYGRIVHTETLNTRKLAKHIAEHGSVYTQDVVEGVLTKAEACIVEMLLESKKVKLEGLGTFYLMAENKKGGAISLDKFNPKGTFNGLHIRFLPDSSSESQLNSKDILAKATFMWAEDLKREKAEARPTTPSNGGGSGSNSGSGSQNSGSQNSGSQNSGSEQGSGSEQQSEGVTAPEISGTSPFTDSTQVTIQGPQGAEVRYTTDGSDPSAESTLYSEAITLNATTTIKAIAILDGESSEVASKTFTKSGESGGFDLGN